jgi:hypothetical protein
MVAPHTDVWEGRSNLVWQAQAVLAGCPKGQYRQCMPDVFRPIQGIEAWAKEIDRNRSGGGVYEGRRGLAA